AWARLVDARGRHRPGGAVHPEDVDAAAVAGRQIHLGRQNVLERGAEGPDVGNERPGAPVRLRPEQTAHEGRRPHERDRGLEERSSGPVVRIHGGNGPAGWGRGRLILPAGPGPGQGGRTLYEPPASRGAGKLRASDDPVLAREEELRQAPRRPPRPVPAPPPRVP